MRLAHRPLLLSALVMGLLVPAAGISAQEDPFASFTHTPNLIPLGSSLRPASTSYNSDLAFWGTKAYQGTYAGFRILDVSDPANPQQLINYEQCAGSQGDVIIWNNLLVRSWNSNATTQTCDGEPVVPTFEGIHIFDVSNPTDPDLITSVRLPCGSHTATGVPDPANGRLLVYNNSSGPCPWFEIVEIPLAMPATARLIGLTSGGRSCHDTNVILGSAMLAACAGGNGFSVFSIGGPRGGSLTSPVQLYSVTVPNVSIGHTAGFSWDGQVLIFGHEPGGGSAPRCQAVSAAHDKSLFFFNAGNGQLLGQWTLPRPQTVAENCTIHNFNVVPTNDGKDIVVSGNYQSGISVVDFTDPANATEIAYADPAPLSPTRLGGDWSSYWYDGTIYESDISRGLLTWHLDDPAVAGAQTLGHLNPQTQEFTIP
jgi:hypothetical protein